MNNIVKLLIIILLPFIHSSSISPNFLLVIFLLILPSSLYSSFTHLSPSSALSSFCLILILCHIPPLILHITCPVCIPHSSCNYGACIQDMSLCTVRLKSKFTLWIGLPTGAYAGGGGATPPPPPLAPATFSGLARYHGLHPYVKHLPWRNPAYAMSDCLPR